MQYYVNMEAQPNGDHEVHHPGCAYFPEPKHRLYLGIFFHCEEAVEAARKRYKQVNGCARCSSACHTQ